jgi:hypothetical protein
MILEVSNNVHITQPQVEVESERLFNVLIRCWEIGKDVKMSGVRYYRQENRRRGLCWFVCGILVTALT